MQSAKEIHVLLDKESAPRISRRELAQALLAGVAAGFLSPLSSAVHPLHKHLLNAARLDFADEHLSPENHAPLFLSMQQLSTLDALGEAIVPGSSKAQAAAFIDLLLNADTREAQQLLFSSLSAFESASQNNFHTAIISLGAAQLHDLLSCLSSTESAGYKCFNHLKDWVVGAYFSSEIGMRELSWAPDQVFPAFPGCSHPGGHA
jgi:hypothetical protein